mmetsp:Transcript_63839/g.106151  ORF Transcript_63839/g.106151 Transcript_63839/m.106151 type:complete len:177 (+) Transcript_63839:154-684(+)
MLSDGEKIIRSGDEGAFKAKQQELQTRIAAERERAQREAARLEELQKELSDAAGPAKQTIESIRAALEISSAEVEVARTAYDEARTRLEHAEKQVELLTETKTALSERLLLILEQNEVAKLKKLEELRQQLDVGEANQVRKSEALPIAAVHVPIQDDVFEGFDDGDEDTSTNQSSR